MTFIVYPGTGATIVGGVVAPRDEGDAPTPVPEAFGRGVPPPAVAHGNFTADDLEQARAHIEALQAALIDMTKQHGKATREADMWKERAMRAEVLLSPDMRPDPGVQGVTGKKLPASAQKAVDEANAREADEIALKG